MSNVVTVSGMFGQGKTYFAGSPVVIDISGLQWPQSSPFNIVRVKVVYGGSVTGEIHADTGGQEAISFDISSALRALWSDIAYEADVAAAAGALTGSSSQQATRQMRSYYLRIYTEYMSSDDGGVFTQTQCQDADGNTDIPGGQCLTGRLTEWERSIIGDKANADVSHFDYTGVRNGDASTKPTDTPERVGSTSVTSWVDIQTGQTKSIFYPASAAAQPDDVRGSGSSSWTGHAPLVLRDSVPYTDFLFVNRRGCVETCSALMREAMSIGTEAKQYARIERPSFKPGRTLMAIASDGRRSWQMSSGHQTRQWCEWWATEFLTSERHWMLYQGAYVPVVVEPAKKSTAIYDRSKQNMESVEFTVTLALEG